MRRSRMHLTVGVLWLLSACAAAPEGRAPSRDLSDAAADAPARSDEQVVAEIDLVPTASPDDETICRTEVVTGTHRPRTICETRAQRRETRAAAQEWYRSGGRDGSVSQVPTVR